MYFSRAIFVGWVKVQSFSDRMSCHTVKENYIIPAVSEILRYTQTEIHGYPVILLYVRIKNNNILC